MQLVSVKLKDGVFVPLEPLNIAGEIEAVVVISEKVCEEAEESASDFQTRARQYFKEKFPDLDVNEDVLELVGILRKHPEGRGKEEYYEYLGRKYR